MRTDDGIGWLAAVRLADDDRLRGADVLARHQLTPELAHDMAGARLVVLIDASVLTPAGVVTVQRWSGAGHPSMSSHHIGPGVLLEITRLLGRHPPPLVVVSVGVSDLSIGDRPSGAVVSALDEVVERVVAVVEGSTGP